MSRETQQHEPRQDSGADPTDRPSARRAWLLAAIAATGVYLPTMAPGLLWGDSGDAQVRVLIGQLAEHRSVARSHPTYYAVAVAVHRTLCVDAARAANLVSALAGIITIANFAWLVASFVRRRLAVACGVALLLLSHTLWQLAAVAEVMTFSTMCLSFELVCLVRFARTGRLRWLMLVGLANGIGWSTHNFAVLTWPAYLVLAVRRWKTIPAPRARSLAATGGAWLVGCVPLLVLTVMEYRQLDNVATTLRSIFFGRYAQQVFNTTITWGLLLRLIAYLGLNFPTPVILLAVPGWWLFRRAASPALWLFFTVAGAAFFAFAARYNVPDQYTFLVHSYVFAALFAAVGLDWWLGRHGSAGMRLALVLLSITGPLVYAAAPSLARTYTGGAVPLTTSDLPYREPYQWFLTPWRTGYNGAERYAREALALLPPEAVLFINATPRPPLEYLQQCDALGRDGHRSGPKFPWTWEHPFRPNPHTIRPYVERGLVYAASDRREYLPVWLFDAGYRFTPVGCLFRVELPTDQTPAATGG